MSHVPEYLRRMSRVLEAVTKYVPGLLVRALPGGSGAVGIGLKVWLKVLRGGSFYNLPRDLCASNHLWADPNTRHRNMGFRWVRLP